MSWLHDNHWRVRGPFGEVEIELNPRSVDAEAREESRRQLSWLLYDFKYGDPKASGCVLEIYAALNGLSRHHLARSPSFHVGAGSPQADVIGDQLLWAAASGRLLARKREVRRTIVALEREPEPVLGPESTSDEPDTPTSWIGLTLVDQNGTPVPNRPYRVVAPDRRTYTGELDSQGTAVVRNIAPGNCQIFCPDYPPHDELTHTVLSGEHISGIALAYGFEDYAVVWRHGKNADLAGKRDVAHALSTGDELFVPGFDPKPQSAPTGAQHQFQIKQSPLKLRIKLLGDDMTPVTDAGCTIDGASLTSDGEGVVEIAVGKWIESSILNLDGTDVTMAVGRLDTVDDENDAGWKARLFNLGFLIDPTLPNGDGEVTFALQDFQAEHSLALSGTFDAATKSKLRDVYGC